jgi:CRISPR-associated protein Cas5t
MKTFWLKIHAPFAAFRGFQAGVYRSTAPVMPPSAAYGLVLNLAGIEMRDYSNLKTTEILKDLPCLQLAIGVIRQPDKSSMYQQLHSYRVGTDEKTKQFAKLTHGAKSWITPVRREMLVDYVGIIGVQTDDKTLQTKVEKGLRGELEESRYGLPFAGDNNFLFDKIEVLDKPPGNVIWYVQHQSDDKQVKGSCRLYVGINRTDNSKTTSSIFVPKDSLNLPLPENAWTWTPSLPQPKTTLF